jgi:hypothetical protein
MGKEINIKTTHDCTGYVTVTVRDGGLIDADETCYVGGRGGRLTLLADPRGVWRKIGGDQNICFHIYKSTSIDNQTLGVGTYAYFDAVLIDTLGAFDAAAAASTTQGVYTVPETGMYTFGGLAGGDVTASGAMQSAIAVLRVDGSNYLAGSRSGSNNNAIDPQGDVDLKSVYLTAGQQVSLFGSGTALTYLEGQIYSGFWGRKLPN